MSAPAPFVQLRPNSVTVTARSESGQGSSQSRPLIVAHAAGNVVAITPGPPPSSTGLRQTAGDNTQTAPLVYLAAYGVSSLLSKAFITQTYLLFNTLQTIALEQQAAQFTHAQPVQEPSPSQIQYYHRLSQLYRNAISARIIELQNEPASTGSEHSHYFVLTAVLALTEILYLPADGRGEGIVGEEVMDWVNRVDPSPSTEEGQELAELERPWEHPEFWSFLHRSVLRARMPAVTAFLKHLASHPSTLVQDLAALTVQILETFPRSTTYSDERTFLASLRAWRTQVAHAAAQLEDLTQAVEEDTFFGASSSDGEWSEMEQGFRGIIELCQGNQKRILIISEDWKEALAAWGIWVNARGRREDLPETLTLLLKHFPLDQTLPAEMIQASLILGNVPRALQQAHLYSAWLVAHLSDLLDKLHLLDAPSTTSLSIGATNISDGLYGSSSALTSPKTDTLSLRNFFVLAYTDILASDRSLWRISLDYLATCGAEGRGRMKQLIMSIPLDENVEMTLAVESGREAAGEADRIPVVEEVLRACVQYDLRDEEAAVCKIHVEALISQKSYGTAVSYCVRAGDAKRMARIAERILEEYIDQGQEAFIHHVDTIPTSLLRASWASESRASSPTPVDEDDATEQAQRNFFASRLSFLARYREFFALYARGERSRAAELLVLMLTSNAAPKRFWAVLLLDVVPLLQAEEMLISPADTYELLRCLEDLVGPIMASKLDPHQDLDALARIFNRSSYASDSPAQRTTKALQQLQVVRTALAKYLSECYCAQ